MNTVVHDTYTVVRPRRCWLGCPRSCFQASRFLMYCRCRGPREREVNVRSLAARKRRYQYRTSHNAFSPPSSNPVSPYNLYGDMMVTLIPPSWLHSFLAQKFCDWLSFSEWATAGQYVWYFTTAVYLFSRAISSAYRNIGQVARTNFFRKSCSGWNAAGHQVDKKKNEQRLDIYFPRYRISSTWYITIARRIS